jgi:O-antigen/teichoic acid export membrane protein
MHRVLEFLRGRDLRALVQTAGITYGGTALSLVSAPLLARTVGADGRGVLAAAFVTLQLLSWVSFLGLPRGLALQSVKRDQISGAGVFVTLGLGVVSAGLAVATADLVSNGDDRVALGIRISAIVLVGSGFGQVGVELLLLRNKIVRYNLTRAAVLVLPASTIIATYFLGALTLRSAYVIMLGGQVLSTALGCVFAVILIRGSAPAPVPWNFSLKYWATSALDAVGGRGDQVALSALTQASVLGVYSLAVTCATASAGLTAALNSLAYSKFAGLNADDSKAFMRRRTLIGITCSLLSGAAIVVVVFFFGRTLFGPTFDGLTSVVIVLVATQVIADQWSLRVLADSAREAAGHLVVASVIGIIVLAGLVTTLAIGSMLTGLTMAAAMFVFSIARLSAWSVLSRRAA